ARRFKGPAVQAGEARGRGEREDHAEAEALEEEPAQPQASAQEAQAPEGEDRADGRRQGRQQARDEDHDRPEELGAARAGFWSSAQLRTGARAPERRPQADGHTTGLNEPGIRHPSIRMGAAFFRILNTVYLP